MMVLVANSIDLQSWWALAKELGPGATVVMGVVMWGLWRLFNSARTEVTEANNYIREANRQNIKTLMELTHTIQEQDTQGQNRHNELTTCINNTCQLILQRLDQGKE